MIVVNYWKLVVLERYAQFEGRASRAEFWYYALATFVVSLVLNLLAQASAIFLILAVGWWLALLIPGIAVGIRRLHDTDKSGLLLLLAFIPIVGAIILIVLWAGEGSAADNQYGPRPAELAAA